MVKVAVSAEFLQAFAQVPQKVQKKVREFARKFLEDPTAAAIHYERIHAMADPKVRTVRIGLDYRAIVIHPPKGDVYTLVWVDHHDEAMQWAARKRFEVNPVVGTLQVFETHDSGVIAVESQGGDRDAPLPAERLLAGRTRNELLRCGVPEPLLPSVCACEQEEDLARIVPYLPADVADTLTMLAAGYAVDEALHEIHDAGQRDIDVDDLVAAIASPAARRRFKLVDNEAQFDALLAPPLSATRTFSGTSIARPAFGDEDEGSWPLVVEIDGVRQQRVIAPGASAVFGRHASCDVLLEDPYVSRRQFRVTNLGACVEIEGLPSKNQTQVVGRRAHDGAFFTSPDVLIRVAGTRVRLQRQGA